MNFFAAVKNFVLSAPKMADDVFDKDKGLLVKAGSFINDLHYSDVEKAKHHMEQGKAATEFVKATLGENTEKSKTRRELAVMWIKVQLSLVLMTVMCVPFATIFPEQGKEVFKLMFEITTCTLMLTGTGCVMVYFFGSYGWGTYIKKEPKK